jgi:hypothetical protein
MKINKNVHFLILLAFIIVFVVIYLYYTITDVKKLAVELKKNTQDIQSIATTLTTLNKSINDLKSQSTIITPNEFNIQEDVEVDADVEEEDTHDDMKKLLLQIDEDEPEEESEEESEEEQPAEPEPEEQQPEESIIDLKLLKLDELRNICKTNNISSKGSKDQLISRLSSL